MHDRRRIRSERAAGSSIRGLARELGASRNAVRRALDPGARLDYWRPSMSAQFEPAVRDVLADDPHASVSNVAAAIEWPGARRTLSAIVEQLRPAALEREREGLNRPSVGAMAVGRMRVGRAKTRSDDGEEGERSARAA